MAPNKGGKKETELYWRWVEEVKPSLPRDFRHNFHMAAILLKVRGAYNTLGAGGVSLSRRTIKVSPSVTIQSCVQAPA